MDFTIIPSSDGLYVILKVRKEITGKTAIKMLLEALALGKQMGTNRILVDVTEAVNTDSELKKYEFAYHGMRRTKGIDNSARIATLISPGDNSHDFVETVSVNAGLKFKLFTDAEQAEEYLLQNIEICNASARL